MEVGKIISIFEISVEVIVNDNTLKIGDILEAVDNPKYRFEVIELTNTSALCISLNSTRGLKKGTVVKKINDGIQMEYSDALLGRMFDAYGEILDGKKIDVEYDGWYWHKDNQERDKRRNYKLLSLGYKILRIKAKREMPTKDDIKNAVNELLNNNKHYIEIILDI